jgi:hypothetical protein
MKMRVMMLVLCAGLALTVGITTASAGGGNSDNAKLCQQGGWEDLEREDGSPFKNDGDCVSYAAQGGTFGQPSSSAGQLFCESLGGTYSTDPATNFFADYETVLWTCNNAPLVLQLGAFLAVCADEGGVTVSVSSTTTEPFYNTCGFLS